MNSHDFRRLVEESAPSVAELTEYGLSDEEREEILRAFRCSPLATTGEAVLDGRSELERLVSENDCSDLAVSQVSFVSPPRAHPAGLVVAFWEADPIVVGPAGEVAAFDHSVAEGASTPCARDSESFLDALALIVEARTDRAAWKGRFEQLVDGCSKRAGGTVYIPFFRSLCAFLE